MASALWFGTNDLRSICRAVDPVQTADRIQGASQVIFHKSLSTDNLQSSHLIASLTTSGAIDRWSRAPYALALRLRFLCLGRQDFGVARVRRLLSFQPLQLPVELVQLLGISVV